MKRNNSAVTPMTLDDQTKAFVTWLDKELKERGWSRVTLMRRAGLGINTVSTISTGKVKPSWNFCAKIAEPLQMSPVDIFRRAGLLPSSNDDDRQITYSEIAHLLSLLPPGEDYDWTVFFVFSLINDALRRTNKHPKTQDKENEKTIASQGCEDNSPEETTTTIPCEGFPVWLAQELEQRGWTLSELARRAGVGNASISRILSGDRQPGPDLTLAIARTLRRSPVDVFRRAGLLPNIPESRQRQFEEIADKLNMLPAGSIYDEIVEGTHALIMHGLERTMSGAPGRALEIDDGRGM